jgi:hypothetical protein
MREVSPTPLVDNKWICDLLWLHFGSISHLQFTIDGVAHQRWGPFCANGGRSQSRCRISEADIRMTSLAARLVTSVSLAARVSGGDAT